MFSFIGRYEKTIKVKSKTIEVYFVPKEELFPAIGMAIYATEEDLDVVLVRDDLPSRVKSFTLQHEIYHIVDKFHFWGRFGEELRANLIPGIKDPFGLFYCVCYFFTNKERFPFYLKRFKEKF